jgi:hypothetical protein
MILVHKNRGILVSCALRKRRHEDHQLKASLGYTIRCCLEKKKKVGPGVVAHACNPSYLEGGDRRIIVWPVGSHPMAIRDSLLTFHSIPSFPS